MVGKLNRICKIARIDNQLVPTLCNRWSVCKNTVSVYLILVFLFTIVCDARSVRRKPTPQSHGTVRSDDDDELSSANSFRLLETSTRYGRRSH